MRRPAARDRRHFSLCGQLQWKRAASTKKSAEPKAESCTLCGEPAVTMRREPGDPYTPLCANHLPPEARETYEALRDLGWDAPPPKSTH
jgi:hypothetical protein